MNLVHFQPWNLYNRAVLPRSVAKHTSDAQTVRNGRPAADIIERDDRFEIVLDLPGVDAQAIEITVEERVLTISAERNETREEKTEEGYRRYERFSGTMQRRFTLPNDVDAEAIAAASANGVLTVTVPKTEAAQPRRISVAA